MESTVTPAPRRRIAFFIASLMVYAVTIILGSRQGIPDTLQTWKGYYTLVLEPRHDLASVVAALEAQGVGTVYSSLNLTVDSGDWGRVQRIPLEEIKPRKFIVGGGQTPWTKGVRWLFLDESGNNNVVYVPQALTVAGISKVMDELVQDGSGGWSILELNVTDKSLMLVVTLAIGIFALINAQGYRWAMLAALVPWVFVVAGLGPGLFPLHGLGLFAMAMVSSRLVPILARLVHDENPRHFFWELIHRPLNALGAFRDLWRLIGAQKARRWVFIYGVVALFILLASFFSGDPRVPGIEVLLLFMAWPSIWVWAAYIESYRKKNLEHRLFMPIPILTPGIDPGRNQVRLLVVLSLASVIVPAYFFLGGAGLDQGGISVPVPQTPSSLSVDLEGLRGVFAKTNGKTRLPNLSWALVHRVMQERMGLERIENLPQWEFLPTGYEIRQVFARTSNGRPGMEGVFTFDETWLQQWLQGLPPGSPELLLASQGNSLLAYGGNHGVYSLDGWSIVGITVSIGAGIFFIVLRRRKSHSEAIKSRLGWRS